jgi:hypothetical protein
MPREIALSLETRIFNELFFVKAITFSVSHSIFLDICNIINDVSESRAPSFSSLIPTFV